MARLSRIVEKPVGDERSSNGQAGINVKGVNVWGKLMVAMF